MGGDYNGGVGWGAEGIRRELGRVGAQEEKTSIPGASVGLTEVGGVAVHPKGHVTGVKSNDGVGVGSSVVE